MITSLVSVGVLLAFAVSWKLAWRETPSFLLPSRSPLVVELNPIVGPEALNRLPAMLFDFGPNDTSPAGSFSFPSFRPVAESSNAGPILDNLFIVTSSFLIVIFSIECHCQVSFYYR